MGEKLEFNKFKYSHNITHLLIFSSSFERTAAWQSPIAVIDAGKLLVRFRQPGEETRHRFESHALAGALLGILALPPVVERILRYHVLIVKYVKDYPQQSCSYRDEEEREESS